MWERYETEEQREWESKSLAELAERWNCVIIQTEALTLFDGVVSKNNELRAIVEHKHRYQFTDLYTYPSLMLGAIKYWQCQRIARVLDARFFAVLSLRNGDLYWADVTDVTLEAGEGVRGWDSDTCVYIPIELFRPAHEIPECLMERKYGKDCDRC